LVIGKFQPASHDGYEFEGEGLKLQNY